jgi:hypothetical protein
MALSAASRENPLLLSLVIPTIPGREHWLERSLAAYEQTTEDYELLIVRDFDTCGKAWGHGLAEATGDYIHLSNDDIEPRPGWWEAGTDILDRGLLPCCRVLNTDGSVQSCGDTEAETPDGSECHVARIPLVPRELVPALLPFPEWHYMVDYWISWKAAQLGWPTVVSRDYLFTHHMAAEGRRDTYAADLAAYEEMTK